MYFEGGGAVGVVGPCFVLWGCTAPGGVGQGLWQWGRGFGWATPTVTRAPVCCRCRCERGEGAGGGARTGGGNVELDSRLAKPRDDGVLPVLLLLRELDVVRQVAAGHHAQRKHEVFVVDVGVRRVKNEGGRDLRARWRARQALSVVRQK